MSKFSDQGSQAAAVEADATRAKDRGLEDQSKALAKLVEGLAVQLDQGHTRPRVALQTLMLRAIAYGRRLERETGDARGRNQTDGGPSSGAAHLRAVK